MQCAKRFCSRALILVAAASVQANWAQCRPKKNGSDEVVYRLTSISNHYDFVIRLKPNPHEGDRSLEGTCEAPGEVVLYPKGSAKPLQTIQMPNIFVSSKGDGEPLTNSAALYDYQGVINVGDFNFDGSEDFAVQNGNHGSYGQPSYDVYLYSAKAARFELNRPMTDLIEQTLGFFHVDPIHDHLVTMEKSGAVYHVTTTYTVIHDRPVPIARIVEDGRKDTRYVYVTHERLVNGKWQRIERRYSAAAYYADQ